MFDECKDCKNGKLLEPDIQDSFFDLDFDSDSNGDNDAVVTFYKWETPDKHVEKARITLPIDAAINAFKASVVFLKILIYTENTYLKH